MGIPASQPEPIVTTVQASKPSITEALWTLYDQIGVDVLSANFAAALGTAHGYNETSSQIAFYRWRAARSEPVEATQAA